MPRIVIETFDLAAIERQVCIAALEEAGSILDAAPLLGVSRHGLRRRIAKHKIDYRRGYNGHRGRIGGGE